MTQLPFAPASHLAALMRRREVGCLELLNYFIARVERLDGKLNAVVVRDFDRARARVRALDNTAPTGPLHGVPMTVKEAFDVAGLPTTWEFPQFTDNIAKADSLAVARLKAAGAVVFGKTNVPKGLADWQSHNDVYADYRGGVTCLMDTQLPEPPSVVGLHVSIRGGEGRQGHSRRTARPPSHGTGPVGWVSPASFNRGLWARLLR